MKNLLFLIPFLCCSIGLNANNTGEKVSNIIIKANWNGTDMSCLDFNGNYGYDRGVGDVYFTISVLNENLLTVPMYVSVFLENELSNGTIEYLLGYFIEVPLTPEFVEDCSTILYKYSIDINYPFRPMIVPLSLNLRKFNYSVSVVNANGTNYQSDGFRSPYDNCNSAYNSKDYVGSRYFCSYSPLFETEFRPDSPQETEAIIIEETSLFNDNSSIFEMEHSKEKEDNSDRIKNNSWIIYPNPFDHELTINFPKVDNPIQSVQILDLNGKVVYQEVDINPLNQQFQRKIEVFNLYKGIYFCRIKTNTEVHLKKILKQ